MAGTGPQRHSIAPTHLCCPPTSLVRTLPAPTVSIIVPAGARRVRSRRPESHAPLPELVF
ncbi:hypothetical protein RHCRD62_40066 [Rhodococcus sp. RD6.2]|nr:hypothetical protein RHCRD62_40066 [Rhodococcus sp. RD6.2]